MRNAPDIHHAVAPERDLLTRLGLGTAHTTVRVPELRNVTMTRAVQSVVDHVAFQRLRRIRQLGPTHLVYPGAVHTRFEHSLGVFGTVQWFISHLIRHEASASALDAQSLRTVLAAGLLHDLGHYPFAHSLEALHLKGRDTPRHEDVGGQILRGEVPTLRGAEPIARLLEREWDVDPERVIEVCTGGFGAPTQTDKILRSIISGAIDADKMDYLERDSHHMGVPYGRHYDRGRLLSSLTLNASEDAIALGAKGKVSAEMFIFSRYTMFSEAYWHHTVRGASAMVEGALAAFHSVSDISAPDLLEVLLEHDDDRLLTWLHDQTPAESATRHLLQGMIGHQRQLYKRVLTLSRVYQEAESRRAYERIYDMDAGELHALTDQIRLTLSSHLGVALHPASIIVDTPPRDKDRLESIDIVGPLDSSGERRDVALHQVSRIVAGIQNDFVHVVKKIRVFAAPTIAARLQRDPRVQELILEEILRAPTSSSQRRPPKSTS